MMIILIVHSKNITSLKVNWAILTELIQVSDSKFPDLQLLNILYTRLP